MNSPQNDPILGNVGNIDDEFQDFDFGNFEENFDFNNFEKILEGCDHDDQELIEEFLKPKKEVDTWGIIDSGKVGGCSVRSSSTEIEKNNSEQMKNNLRDISPTSAPSFGSSESLNFLGVYENQHDVTPKSKTKHPRKYTLKPPEVKQNPVYQEKRSKNNDAVRKSREKAKREQQEKDELLSYLQIKNRQLSREKNQLKQQVAVFLQRCQCGLVKEIPADE